MIERFAENPLIVPADVTPSRPDMEVIGAFNPGAVRVGDDTLLLVRVAERPVAEPGYAATAVLDPRRPGEVEILRFRTDDPDFAQSDPRAFSYKGETYLTSLSHLRVARAPGDGRAFTLDPVPSFFPAGDFEAHGAEDARVIRLDDWYYLTYSAASPHGIVPAMARTRDFVAYERLGAMFPPHNKDIALFPEKIGGLYYALHRPCTSSPALWIASSPDLAHWGGHREIMGTRPGEWDGERIGCGAEPIRTERGWLQIYHGAIVTPDGGVDYRLGAVLLDLREPWKVLKRLRAPILSPTAPYEADGFVPRVVFHNGLVDRGGGVVDLYYGAADERTSGARLHVPTLLARLDAAKDD